MCHLPRLAHVNIQKMTNTVNIPGNEQFQRQESGLRTEQFKKKRNMHIVVQKVKEIYY